MAEREQVVREITEIVREIWPNAVVRIFGSQMTKILTPSSDLDIAVLEVPEGNMTTTDLLYELEKAILFKGIASYIEVLSNAKVPIVKFDHRSTGISIDVCVNNSSGLSTGKLIKGYVRKYPPLRPLTIVLKMFLSQRRLNETYGGGMGSFVLVTIIISFLQMRSRNLAYRKVQQSWNLGALLLEFFVLYGHTFNYVHTGISISKGGFYFEKLCRPGWFNPVRPMSLSLENPDDCDVDIGRNSFQMQKIRRAFEHGQQVLTCALIDNRVESFLTFLIRPDDPSLTGRPGPGLTSCGVSQISDSEAEGESENDKDNSNHKDSNKHPGNDNDSIKKAEKRQRDRKKNKGANSKEDERGETDISISKHINSTSDTSANLKDVKKRKSKGGSSSEVEVVVYDIRSDNEIDTDVVQVFPTQQSAANIRLSKRKTSVEDLFYHTKEADRWDSHPQTPGIGAQSADLTTSKKKKKIDGEGSTKKKKTSHPAKNVPSSSDSDSSEDDYDGVVLRR